MWHYAECGAGRPLVLLHGVGMSHAVWKPVLPHLSASSRVIAFDIAGFGSTPPLPDRVAPTVPHLVEALARSLQDLRLPLPVDLAGNSLGGWLALEAARQGIARTVVAISPAGLWGRRPPWHVPPLFYTLRTAAKRFPHFVKRVVGHSVLRELLFAVPISVGSRRMSIDDAQQVVEDLARASRFEETLEHTRGAFRGADIQVPVTVAFGARDWVLTRSARNRKALPPHTRWVEPRGWGHVPMWADPAGVAALILEGAFSAGVLQ